MAIERDFTSFIFRHPWSEGKFRFCPAKGLSAYSTLLLFMFNYRLFIFFVDLSQWH